MQPSPSTPSPVVWEPASPGLITLTLQNGEIKGNEEGNQTPPNMCTSSYPQTAPRPLSPSMPWWGYGEEDAGEGERQDEDWETGREGRSGREEGGTYKGVGKQRCVGHNQDGQSYFNRDHLVLLHNANVVATCGARLPWTLSKIVTKGVYCFVSALSYYMFNIFLT